MKIRICIVGKIKNPAIKDLERDFLQRLKNMGTVEVIVVKPSTEKDENADKARTEEGKRLRESLSKSQNEIVVALHERAGQMTSHGFAEFLEKRKTLNENIAFVIGGPFGLDKKILEEADMLLSLSEMTWPHEIAFVLLLEQIYRGFSILAKSKYHK